MKKRITTIVIALSVFFAISLTALAVGDNYDMSSDLRRLGDEEGRSANAIRTELLTPSDYLSAGLIESEGIYYFEIQTEMDSTKDIDFSFWFKGTLCKPTETQSKTNFIPYFKVYSDSSLSNDSLIASYENQKLVWDSQNQDGIDTSTEEMAAIHNNESILRFHIAAGVLEQNTNYYLVLEKDIVNPKFPAAMKLPRNGVYKFKTKEIKTGREQSDGRIITSNGAPFTVLPSFVSKDEEKTSADLFINHDTSRYEIDGEVPFQGRLELNVTMTPESKKKYSHLVAYVCDPEKPETKLQEFNIADDSETKIENEILSIDTNNLELGKTYYLVMDQSSQSGEIPFGEDVVFEFQTHKHSLLRQNGHDPTCEGTGLTDGEKCTSCGTITIVQEEIPALGHEWVVIEPGSAPTCTMPEGNDKIQCSRCRSTTFDYNTPRKPALGHEEYVSKEGKEPTCSEKGLTDEVSCSRCNEIIKAQEEIDKLPHTEIVVEGKAATCTEKGLTDGKKCSVCGEILEEQKEIPALGHTEEVVKGKAATCTEKGLTDGKKCSVCDTVLEEQKEIPALGHKEEVVKGKATTCTEKGLTDGKKCSVCGTVLEEQKEIPALGHDFKDGKCTRCDAVDPDYKPTPVEPISKFTGLANEADKDGVWWYYTDGKIDKTHTGVDQNKNGWWRVENGKVNFKAQGIYQNKYGWWKTTDGKVTFDETGIFQNEYGWWRVEDSKVNFKANGIYKNPYGWWKTTNGKVTFKENGVFKNEYGWWKVEKSKVNFKFTGIAKNDYGTWYVKNGKVDFSKNGKVAYNGKTYQVTDGKAKLA